MNKKVVKKISRDEHDYWQPLLDEATLDFDTLNILKWATLKTYLFDFGGGVEAEIKICSGDKNLFIDPVLFINDKQLQVLDCEGDLLGDYEFELDNNSYIASIEI